MDIHKHSLARCYDSSEDEYPPTESSDESIEETEKHFLDVEGMIKKGVAIDIQAECQGFRCLFCKRFLCLVDQSHIPDEYKECFLNGETDGVFEGFVSARHKKHSYLITYKRARSHLNKKCREHLETLRPKNGEIKHGLVPFCIHKRLSQMYPEICEKCGKRVLAWDLPDHMDFHFAKDMQDSWRNDFMNLYTSGNNISPGMSRTSNKNSCSKPPLKKSKMENSVVKYFSPVKKS